MIYLTLLCLLLPWKLSRKLRKVEEDKEDTEEIASNKDDPLTSLAQLSAQAASSKVGTSESKTKMTSTAKSLDNKGDVGQSRLLQDFQQLTLTEQS